MKHKFACVILFGIISICCFETGFAFNGGLISESIESFSSKITVNADASINVVEDITYNSGDFEKHGIFRDIRLQAFNGKIIHISDVSVVDENGAPYKFIEKKSPGWVSIKIGDPERTFSGKKTYSLRYKIKGAIGYFKKYDEIYWNVTGNDWPFSIKKVFAEIYLPENAEAIQSMGYYGRSGSKTTFSADAQGRFVHEKMLLPGEGVTVAVGFTKNMLKSPDRLTVIISEYAKYLLLLIPVFTFILMFFHWKKNGKDPVSDRAIIVQYDIPDKLNPIKAEAVVSQKIRGKAISAEIIYLAVNGHLKIQRVEKKAVFIKTTDYILKKTSTEACADAADRLLISKLFENADEVKVSDLKNSFYINISKIIDTAFKTLVEDGYYKNNPRTIVKKYYFISGLVILAGIFTITAFLWKIFVEFNVGGLVILSFASSALIIYLFGMLMPARTEKGLKTKEHLFGLREYLDIAEKDRINFHNAPKKSPETFEKFLPYAMIFNLEKAWAKEFEDVYTQPPNWYSDSSINVFNAVIFSSHMAHFTTFTNSVLTSTPMESGNGSSGGSGGGGSSGGGGGGGGGGSW